MGSAAEFGALVDACGMAQVPSSGRKFTWSNNRRRGNVSAVLDRCFCNEEWIDFFQDCGQRVLPRIASDHSPLLFTSILSQRPVNCPFRFHKFWMEHGDFEQVVATSWEEWVSGNPIFVLMLKLKRLKGVLRNWGREAFPNFNKALEEAKDKLAQVQQTIEINGMDDHLFGLRNSIRSLKTPDGTLVEGNDQIGNYTVQSYEQFYKAVPLVEHEELLESIPMVLHQGDHYVLDVLPGKEEIKRARDREIEGKKMDQFMKLMRDEHRIFTDKDDNEMMQLIMTTHSQNCQMVDVEPLLELIKDILKLFTTTTTTTTNIAVVGNTMKSLKRKTSAATFEALVKTIHEISCEISCKCTGEKDNTMSALIKTLASYSWDAKVLLVLAAFAVTYRGFFLLGAVDVNKSKPLEMLRILVEAMVTVIECVVNVCKLPRQKSLDQSVVHVGEVAIRPHHGITVITVTRRRIFGGDSVDWKRAVVQRIYWLYKRAGKYIMLINKLEPQKSCVISGFDSSLLSPKYNNGIRAIDSIDSTSLRPVTSACGCAMSASKPQQASLAKPTPQLYVLPVTVTFTRQTHSHPLARRHERSPVVPLYKPATATAAAVVKSNGDDCYDDDLNDADGDGEETEAASWLLPNPNQISSSKLRI
ncbi:uncharacterized protein LOC122072716 [Macadamia integrifolia]|uniref:uncharacterized protein LOC122072716 n=1 Tax=Macadamia integrifolia TaxID=60698 RepID=UPI001C4F54EC|nr:uncharacterized protein LOC122072716 [Macadamia integrifolia]